MNAREASQQAGKKDTDLGIDPPRFRTVVDMNRGGVDVTEYTIESWLYERPDLICGPDLGAVTHWIGRQYRLPTGVADLIGKQANGNLSLIEVKEFNITRANIWQVRRYAAGIEQIIGKGAHVDYIVVCRGARWDILDEARSAGIKVFSYSILGQWGVYHGLTLRALWPVGVLHHV